jgi:hypothetical protein
VNLTSTPTEHILIRDHIHTAINRVPSTFLVGFQDQLRPILLFLLLLLLLLFLLLFLLLLLLLLLGVRV